MVGDSAGQSKSPREGAGDRTLVERAQEGDRAAFGELYRRHVDRVYSFIVFRIRDPSVAEDLCQDVFFQALRSIGGFRWRGSVAPWLLRIARNMVIDHWRRAGRRPERAMTAMESPEEDGLADRVVSTAEGDADEEAERVLTRDRIAAAASNLTDLQEQVLALRFSAGLSIKETADVMGKSEGAVKNLQHHALKALKRHLES